MKYPNIYLNAIDKIYAEKTGMPYPVSAAVGGSPTPQEQLDVSNVLFTWNGDAGYTATMDITVNGAPEGCYPMFAINTMDGEYQYNFELTDIQDGKLTLEIGWIGYDLLGDMVDVVIYKDSSQDPENIWKEVSVPFTAQLVPTFGPWTEDQENENYFYGSMSFENNILFEDGVLPEGWTAKVITDYGEVNLTVDDVTSANSIDIPIDTTDLTNLIHYTGEDQSLSTEFRLFNTDGHLMYYTEPVDVNVEYYEEPTQKFTLNSVMIDGPYSGGPFSNVYNCHFDMAFNETPPADCEDGYGGYHGYAVITGVCVADETGVIKDTGNYQINGIVTEYDHPDEYQYQSGDPTYPYGQTFGPATLTITDGDGNVWGTATTNNVSFINQ